MKRFDLKKFSKELLIDIAGGMLLAIAVYNFASNAGFPIAGISGIALIIYHLTGLPMGAVTIGLNIPIIIICYKFLGRDFFIRSLKTMIISSFLLDYVAPLFPVYEGDRLLAAICTGVLQGFGFGMIYSMDTSTGGMDFVIMTIRKLKPYMSIGKITLILDVIIVGIGGFLIGDVESIIYGFILTYLVSMVIDKYMYGLDAGKVTFIVTEHGMEVAEKISDLTERGSTLLKARGSFTNQDKDVVMCACNNKQMHLVQEAVKKVDREAFLITMESNEVRGEGFKDH